MVYVYKLITVHNAIKDCEINITLLYFELYADHLLMLSHDNLKEAFMQGASNSLHELTTQPSIQEAGYMAICDPIDLHERSQAFHEEFFLHHVEHGNPWFIKDSELRYVAASRSFLELCGLSEQCSIFGKTDSELSSTLSYFAPKSSFYESVVIKESKSIKTLEVNFFNSNSNLSIRLFNRKVFVFSSEEIGVITYIENSDCFYFDTKIYDYKFSIERKNGSINIGRIVESYRNKSPGELLTDREWTIAWLILMGRCHDNISTILKLKKSHVTNVASEIYRKLGVPDRSVFIIAFKYCGWCDFIPQEILGEPASFLIEAV